MNIDFKKLLPHLLVVLAFIAISLAYFFPVLEGKVIEQHDIAQWDGMSKAIVDFREKYKEEPLWTRSMFGGMPAYQISVLYPANLIKYVNDVLFLGLPVPVAYIFVALIGFYLLLLSMKIDFKMAFAGALAFAFSSYNLIIVMAGHNSKVHAIALVPLVIAGIIFAFNKKYLLGGAITAMALSLQIYANHLQITYYLAIAIGLWMLVKLVFAIKEKILPDFAKAAAVLMIAAVLAILPNITGLMLTYEYGKDTTRGPSELTEKSVSTGLDMDYAFSWSYGIYETMTLLIPDFYGGSSTSELGPNSATYQALADNGNAANAKRFTQNAPMYWGEQSVTAGPTYVGAIMIFLFVVGMFLVKGEYKWWLVITTILFIMLSWGKNFMGFNEFFFHHFPGYNKFRAVTIILSLLAFTVPLLGILALAKLFDGKILPAEKNKALLYSFYITGGICLIYFIVPSLAGDFSSTGDANYKDYPWLLEALLKDRQSALRMDAFRSLFFIAAAFGVLYFTVKGTIKQHLAVWLLAGFILVDLWVVDKRYLDSDNFVSASKAKQPFQPSDADLAILQDKEPGYRVMNMSVSTFNDAGTSYFHNSIGGYHGAKLKRYQELIEYQISRNNMAVLDMLNTRYFIVPDRETNRPLPQRNPGALGPAWFVKEFKLVANADSEITALTDFVPSQTAIIDVRFKDQLAGFNPKYDSTGVIKLTAYKANHLTYTTKLQSNQLAVFSEIYYDKGWNAYIDGKPVPHLRANYVLRAMKIPAGNHTIEFKFEPKTYYTGEKIALAGSVLVLLIFVGGVFMELRNSGSNDKRSVS